MYSIRFDPGDGVLHLTLEGFWSPATLALFTAEMLARGTALRLRRRRYGVLSDARTFPIQTPLVAAGLGRIMARGAEFNAGPNAIVVGSVLNKMQAERTLGSRARAFLDPAEARAWLVAELAAAAVAA